MSNTSTSIPSTPTTTAASTAAAFSRSPNTPPPPREDEEEVTTLLLSGNNSNSSDDHEHNHIDPRPNTPIPAVLAMASTDGKGHAKEVAVTTPNHNANGKVIYTPASTVSSSKADSTYGGEENSSESAGGNSSWSEWWKAEGIAAQVGSLSKELTELKDAIANKNLDGETNDMSRLKANHRSSLASLAEFHRSEMAGLNASHIESMKKMELQHMEELRSARRVNGHDRDLVQGLHHSYSKQIESLVLDLGEARREVKELKLKQPSSVSSGSTSVPTDPALEKVRTLVMNLTFENLNTPLDTAALAIPHPGRSFDSLLRILASSVKNHLQTLNSTASFFMRPPRGEHAEVASKIKHWYEAALQERVHFSLTSSADAEGKTTHERWENGYWKCDEFVLGVLCTVEGWESNITSPYSPETVEEEDDIEDHIHDSVLSPLGRRSPVERLVSIESSISEQFDPVAELERINREIGNLQLHQHLQEQADRDLRKRGSKENCEPTPPSKTKARKATVESVNDEDDVPLSVKPTLPTKYVPIVNPPKPRQQPVETATSSTTPLREESQPEPMSRARSALLEEGLKEFLENDIERAELEGKTTGSGDSWLFEDLFSTPTDQGKDKDDGSDDDSTCSTGVAGETVNRGVPLRSGPSNSKSGESARRGSGNGRRSGFGWRWLPEGGTKSPPLFSVKDRHPTPKPTKQDFTPPARETYMGNVTSDSDGNDQDDSDYYHPHGDARTYFSGRPLFDFVDARLSPAPPPAPPAPEGTTRDSPTVPDYAQTDVGTSHDQGESAHGNDDQVEATDDTPVMGKAQSVVSSTPLLGSDATSHKSVRFGGKKRPYPSEEAGLRMPAHPFPPSSGSGPKGGDSPRSSGYSASQYLKSQGYFRSGSNNDTQQVPGDGWGGSQYTANSEYEPESMQGEKICGYGQGHEAYTWRCHQEQQAEEAEDEQEDEDEDDEGGYRSSSVSPPLSRSSMTTTDRRTEYVPDPYNQPLGNNLASPFRYGFGGMLPMAMGPLGPRSGMPAFSNPQHIDMIIQQQMRGQMEELLAGNFGPPPRSSTAPTFSSGPVFAPNPPHSVAARSGGGGVPVNTPQYASNQGNNGSAGSAGNMNGLTRYPFDSWPISPPNMSNMSLHMPHLHHHHLFTSNGEPRRSFSNDSISPLLCQQGQGHSPSNSNNPGIWQQHQQQQQQQQQQGGTPVSISQQQQQWFQQQQQQQQQQHQQGIPPPFEVNWDGNPVNVPMRMPGPWAGYAA